MSWQPDGSYVPGNYMQQLLGLNNTSTPTNTSPYGAFTPISDGNGGYTLQGGVDVLSSPQSASWLSRAQGIGTLLQGLGSLGSIWGGLQNLKQARREFAFNKKLTTQNYANQAKLTNMQLADQYRGRNRDETDADVAAYMALSGIQETL